MINTQNMVMMCENQNYRTLEQAPVVNQQIMAAQLDTMMTNHVSHISEYVNG